MSQVQINPVLCTDMYIYVMALLASYPGRSRSLIMRLWSCKPYAEFIMLMHCELKVYTHNVSKQPKSTMIIFICIRV